MVLLAWAAIDLGAAWIGHTPPVSCVFLPVIQMLAMAAAFVLVCIGFVVWTFSRFKSRESLFLMAGGLLVAVVPLLLNGFVMPMITAGCGD